MKRFVFVLFVLFIASFIYAGQTRTISTRPNVVKTDDGGNTRYDACVPTNPSTDYISNVTFADINNTTAGTDDPDGDDQPGYDSFISGTAALVNPGSTYQFSVGIHCDGAENVIVWIDWNQDNVFNTTDEQFVVVSDETTSGTYSCNITVPNTATIGTTTMRVALRYNAAPTSTGSWTYGEVEDYPVMVNTLEPNTPVLANGTVSPSQGIPASQYTFSVQYRNTGGLAPTTAQLFIDGALSGSMTGPTGTPDWTSYQTFTCTATNLSVGSHTYYFYFVGGTEATLPVNAPTTSFTGLTVVAPITSFPLTQDFATWPPAGWTLSGTRSWDTDTSGDGCAYANFWNWEDGTANMDSPIMTLGSNYILSFDWSHLYSVDYPNDNLVVQISTDLGATWTDLWNITGAEFDSNDGADNTSCGSFTSHTISLASYAGATAIIRFSAISGYGPNLYLDYIFVGAPVQEPVFRMSPLSLNFFGTSHNFASDPSVLTITNAGTDDLIINTPVFSGADSGLFSIVDDYTYPLTIAHGENRAFHVVYTAYAYDRRTATITFPNNGVAGLGTRNVLNLSGVAVLNATAPSGAAFTQLPDNNSILTSDASAGLARFDNATFNGTLTAIRFWGSMAQNNGVFVEAEQDPISLEIILCNSDSLGQPDISNLLLVESHTVHPINMGIHPFNNYVSYLYDISLNTPIALNGTVWVGIVGESDGNNCWNMLRSSSDGDGSSYMFNGTSLSIDSNDFAFSLVGDVSLSPVSNLNISMMGSAAQLTWNPVTGASYYIVQSASSVNGPWSNLTNVYDTGYYFTGTASTSKLFFRVIATTGTSTPATARHQTYSMPRFNSVKGSAVCTPIRK